MRTTEFAHDERPPSPAWGNRAPREPRWPATLALCAALALYVALPERLIYAPFGVSQEIARWIVPGLELALIIPLRLSRRHQGNDETKWQRRSALALIGLVNLANLGSLILLVDKLLHGSILQNGTIGLELIYAAVLIWLTNVIIFGLWYWELDRGGPGMRCAPEHREPDFLFPQMINPNTAPSGWTPQFFDYLYVSFTNATAFSPTDTMPLTEMAKSLMLVQSLASLLIVALVAARAVNILGA
jgi:uncharacterized membrane protein